MDRKKVLIALIAIILIVIIVVVSIIIFTKKDRDYDVTLETEYIYYLLNIDDKYGIINRSGDIIIEPEYDKIDIPNSDKGVFVTYKEDNIMVLNEKAEVIFKDLDVSAIETTLDYNEDAIEYDTTRLKYKENNRYGLLDFDGNKITEPLYDEIISLPGKYGEYRVKLDSKYGVISNEGEELVDIKYDFISGDGYSNNGDYKSGGYIIGENSDNGILYGYIDREEKEILKMENEGVYRVLDMPTEDTYLVITQNGRSSIYKDKKTKTDYLYMEVSYLEDSNMFIVKKNKSYGLLNSNLEVVIDTKYDELIVAGMYINASIGDDIYVFDLSGKEIKDSEYIGLEQTATEKYYIAENEESLYGVLDSNMEVVIPAEYDYIKEIDNTDLIMATKGNAITIYSANIKEVVHFENASMEIVNDYIKLTSEDDIIYYTLDGKEVDNKTVYLENEIFSEKRDGKWGFVDIEGNEVVSFDYDRVTEVNEYGFAGIYEDGKWGVINAKGEIILEPTYESSVENPTFIGEYCLNGNECSDEVI